MNVAAIGQLGERQTEDLKVPGSIPGLGTHCRDRALRRKENPFTQNRTPSVSSATYCWSHDGAITLFVTEKRLLGIQE
jgi:hypothetical protein